MGKLFESIGTIIATACLIQLASNPLGALKDIQRGPMPELAKFDRSLQNPKRKKVRECVSPTPVSWIHYFSNPSKKLQAVASSDCGSR